MKGYYHGKYILLTGASSGIGAEMAVQLAKGGAHLILTGRDEARLEETKRFCEELGSTVDIIVADLATPQGVQDVLTFVKSETKKLDVLVCNAGVSQRSLAIETNLEVDRAIMEINFFAAITLAKGLDPLLTESKAANIIIISSMAGLMGFPKRSAYAAAKHALIGYFETWQLENDQPNFHITIAIPGRIQTPISTTALVGDGSLHGKMDKGQLEGIAVAMCVEKILTAAANKKKRVVIARGERVLYTIKQIWPSVFRLIARKAGGN